MMVNSTNDAGAAMSAAEAAAMTARVLDDATYEKAARQALQRPPDYLHFGDPRIFNCVGLTFGRSRDSDPLEESNYRSVLRDMSALAEFLHPGQGREWVGEHCASHWLVGWLERITVRVLVDPEAGITAANLTPEFIAVTTIAARLTEGYPVYDESDYAECESGHYDEVWTNVRWPDFHSGNQERDRCDHEVLCDCVSRPEPLDTIDTEALFHEITNHVPEYNPDTWSDFDMWDGIVRLAEREAYQQRKTYESNGECLSTQKKHSSTAAGVR